MRAKLFTLPGTVKGRLLLKTGKATVLRMRSFRLHRNDMHPVDLIRDSSMPVRRNFNRRARCHKKATGQW
ncbi:MAG: hypothetical protein RBS73_18300 [Prolixibacteraceae bacterium]|nr:hypothetical protein [Prolixibacteraceae bacterium]